MIPDRWVEDRRELAIRQHDQRERIKRAVLAVQDANDRHGHPIQESDVTEGLAVALAPDETLITDADFEALAAMPVTAEEIAQLQDVRGEYLPGDTRGFVETHELTCVQYNCWMVRGADGAVGYLSEAPVTTS